VVVGMQIVSCRGVRGVLCFYRRSTAYEIGTGGWCLEVWFLGVGWGKLGVVWVCGCVCVCVCRGGGLGCKCEARQNDQVQSMHS